MFKRLSEKLQEENCLEEDIDRIPAPSEFSWFRRDEPRSPRIIVGPAFWVCGHCHGPYEQILRVVEHKTPVSLGGSRLRMGWTGPTSLNRAG